jgi:hypothetical protein
VSWENTYVINDTATVKNTSAASDTNPASAAPSRLQHARNPAPKATTSKNSASK